MTDERTSVLIAGAGLAGCSSALFLARRGIDVLLVERHSGTSIHPRATGQYPWTMEMLRVGGVADQVVAASHGLGQGMTIKIAESVRGTVYRTIVDGNEDYDTSAISPAPWGMASQDVVEPILLDAAGERGATIRFATEVVDVDQDGNGVTARLLDRSTGRLSTVRADYLIAADGHRSPIRERLGIKRNGKGALSHMVGVMFDADLSEYVDDDSVALYFIRNDAMSAVFINTGVPHRHLMGFDYYPDRGQSAAYFTNDRVTELIRIGLADPAVVPDIKVVQAWEIAANIAERFADGRIFLVGDAAKVTPPTGGLGGNTAIGDGYDIAWKLADVLDGVAGPGLLDSYQAERKPYAEQIVNTSLHNFKARLMPSLDLSDLSDLTERVDLLALGFGFRCRSDAVIAGDDDPALAEDPTKPSGRPGFRAPHANITVNGAELSTRDLFGNCWVLIAADDEWQAAAEHAANVFGVGLTTYRVDGATTQTYGIGDAGASLIRPDGVVAWRTAVAGTEPTRALVGALGRLLDRPDA
ncbi:MAG TPA: FAD-dependent oxidoreductase [Pseudonocardiaceae bacterium]